MQWTKDTRYAQIDAEDVSFAKVDRVLMGKGHSRS